MLWFINLRLNEKKVNKVTIYLPVEIKGRELKSHIILSKFAAKLGMRTYIGSKPAIFRLVKKKKTKAGVFVYKAGLKTSELLNLNKIYRGVLSFIKLGGIL